MLVLSRKFNEKIVIVVPGLEAPFVVTMAGIQGDKARIGIEAPDNVQIHRLEVWDRIQGKDKYRTPA